MRGPIGMQRSCRGGRNFAPWERPVPLFAAPPRVGSVAMCSTIRRHPHEFARTSPARWVSVGFALLSALIGCRSLAVREVASEPTELPKTQLSQDSVVLEVLFLDVPDDDPEWPQRIWAEIDEQEFPPESRRQLQANGFRCGIIGQQMPVELRELIDAQHSDPAEMTSPDGLGKSLERQTRRIQRGPADAMMS